MSLHATEWFDADAVKSSTECWQVVGIESALTFSLRHLVMSEIRGRFRRWGAILILDREDQSRALLKAWIDLASIDTGSFERDHHIRSAEFFDVARFPFAEFRSDEIVSLDAQRFVARGALALHGETQPLELIVTPGPRREDAGVARAAYEVRATIDRRAFGLRWNQDLDAGGLVVGDRIDLHARVQAMRIPDGRHSDHRAI
jgi:polyisoprenoid-binding protein YceI